MKKILCFVAMIFLSVAIPMSSIAASQGTTTPQLPQVVQPDLTGAWTLFYLNVGMVTQNGAQQGVPNSLMSIQISSVANQNGNLVYSGSVDGYVGSIVTVIYQPTQSVNYIEVHVYIPFAAFPGSTIRDAFVMDNRMFVINFANGGEYFTGAMGASWNSSSTNGQMVPDAMYHGNVTMSRQGGRG